MTKKITKDNRDVEIAIFNELGTAMRNQSQAEYVYTGAAVAAFGAISLGISALSDSTTVLPFALEGVIFIVALAAAVHLAIRYNHIRYKDLRSARIDVAKLLATTMEDDKAMPVTFTAPGSPDGVKRSYWILWIAAAGAISLCVLATRFGIAPEPKAVEKDLPSTVAPTPSRSS